jgi:hypothetical protein
VDAVLPWIVAYLAILLVWALIILRRTGPTLWKGRSLVATNIAFVVISTGVILLKGLSPGSVLIAFDIILIIAALMVREKWLLLRVGHAGSVTVLERCFVQTRASAVRQGEEYGVYGVQCGAAEMMVTIRPTIGGLMSVRFTGGTGSKKAALVRALFCKQFHNSFPTPRFRA